MRRRRRALGAGGFVLWLPEHRDPSEHYQGKTAAAFLKSLSWSVALVAGRDFPSAAGYKAAPPDTRWGRAFVGHWADLETLRVGTVEQSDAQEHLRASGIDSTGDPGEVPGLTVARPRRVRHDVSRKQPGFSRPLGPGLPAPRADVKGFVRQDDGDGSVPVQRSDNHLGRRVAGAFGSLRSPSRA